MEQKQNQLAVQDQASSLSILEKMPHKESQMIQMHKEKIKMRDIKVTPKTIEVNLNLWKKVAFTLGITREIAELEAQALFEFVQTEFIDFSLSEVDLAFKKYSAGAIEFEGEHFGTLSTLFVGRVLKSYRKMRHKALSDYERMKDANKPPKVVTEEEKGQIRDEFMRTCLFQPYKKAMEEESDLNFDDDVGSDLFLKFYKAGHIKPTKKQLKEFRRDAIAEITKPKGLTVNKQEVKEISELTKRIVALENGGDDKELEIKIKIKASALFFNFWINNQRREGVDIKSFNL